MIAAVFKASYNYPHDKNIIGGVCGSAFFINDNIALTANHVLNSDQFKPNDNFLKCEYWLLLRNGKTFKIEKEYLKNYPEVDTTMINFSLLDIRNIFNHKTTIGKVKDGFVLEGFLASLPGNPTVQVSLKWTDEGEMMIESFSLDSVFDFKYGTITDINFFTLATNDIVLNNRKYLKLSCEGNIGLSGAPLVKSSTDEIMGMMSFGLPADAVRKKELFAISIDEIKQAIA